MCDGYPAFYELFDRCEQEERIGLECRPFRFVRALLESAKLREAK